MGIWEVILPAIIAFFTAFITSLVTQHVTQKNEVKKHILEKRTELYLEFFPVIDKFINSPQLVFDSDYMDEFIAYKAKMKLLASSGTFKAYNNLFNTVIEPYNFADMYTGYINGEDTSTFDAETFSKLQKEDLDLEPDVFAEKFMPDRDRLCELIQTLYQEMRNDLGSNIK